MRCANSWQYVSWERKRVSHRSWLKGVPGREGVSGLDGSWSQQRALEGGHWSLSTEHVSGVRQDQPVCTIKVEAPSHETKRKANTSFTKVTGVAVSIYVSRILPKEVPSYQFCKSLPLSSKIYFSHCKSLTSPEMLCTVHVYFTITGSWGWGRRSTMSWPVCPTTFICWSLDLQDFRSWLYLEEGPLKGYMHTCMHSWSCLTLHDPMDCSPPGSSVHGILQARILDWVSTFFSRGSFPPRDWTFVSWVSCNGRRLLYCWTTWEAHLKGVINLKWGSEWNLIHSDQYPYQQRKFGHTRKHQRWVNTEDRPRRGLSKKAAVCKPRREASEIKSAKTKRLDFQPPDLWENTFLLFKLPSLWFFFLWRP